MINWVVRLARERGVRVLIRTARCRASLLVDREVRAADELGNPVPWSRAFPGTTPSNVLAQCGVSRIDVYCGSQLIAQFNRIEDLLNAHIRCT